MPIPIAAIGSLLGAGGSIYSGLTGAAQGNAALRMAMLNYQLQRDIARQQYELATAGTEDIRGNRTRYVPGVGWTTEPTPMTRTVLNASDREELNRLQQDAPRARRGKVANEQRRMQESPIADALLRQVRGDAGAIPESLMRSRIADVLLSDITDKDDFARNAVGMQAARTGEQGNAQMVADQIGKNTRSGVRSALAKARMDAPIEANRQNTELRTSNLNRYNLLAGRASNAEDFPFSPTSIGASPEANLSKSMTMGPYSLAGASAALGKGGELYNTAFSNYQKNRPNYGLMAGGLSEAIENIVRGFRSGSSGSKTHETAHLGDF